MKSNNDVPFTQWAAIYQSEKFISVEPLSGYRRHLREDAGYRIYLEPSATEEALGRTLLEVLNRSRFIDPRKERGFFKADRIMKADDHWHQDFMTRFGYKTKSQAYKNMSYCLAKRCEGKISIEPHRRDKPQYWWDLPADRTVVIPAKVDAAVAGAALKLALSHCE
jgi:hypothetical protein